MSRNVVIVALVAAMALTLTGLAWADQGCADCDGQCVDYPKRARMPMLTAEQREQVKAKAAELHEQGASPEEVSAAIAEMLKEWGIKFGAGLQQQRGQQAAPPRWGQQGMGMMQPGQQGMGMMQPGQQGMGMMQRGMGMMQRGMGMMQRGVGMMQQRGQQAGPLGWGHQGPPPQWGQQQQQAWRGQQGGVGQQAQRSGWQMMMQRLTPEQREQLKDMVAGMKEDGASKQEIHNAVVEQLKEWGVERPQRPAQNP